MYSTEDNRDDLDNHDDDNNGNADGHTIILILIHSFSFVTENLLTQPSAVIICFDVLGH